MKTILLPINDDQGAGARMQVALDLARAFGAHLTCLQPTPMSEFVVASDYGGVIVLEDMVQAVEAREARLRAETEARLASEDVAWDYAHVDGNVARTIIDRSQLADVVVVSPHSKEAGPHDPLPLAGDVAVHSRAAILTVPRDIRQFPIEGRALVAWNGSAEAAYALKRALPLLRLAASVTMVTVAEPDATDCPGIEAHEYLARQGVNADLCNVEMAPGGIADAILAARALVGADHIVMGAYGHSRFRELVLGGVTRQMLRDCPVPILLAH